MEQSTPPSGRAAMITNRRGDDRMNWMPRSWLFGIILSGVAIAGLFISAGAGGQFGYFGGLTLFVACVFGVFALISSAYNPARLHGMEPVPADDGAHLDDHDHAEWEYDTDFAAPHVEEGQQHPISVYLKIWGWLFILSVFSYMVELADLQGYLRWSLILLFMMLKAGLIVAYFMHVMWERLALTYAILLPPLAVLVFVWLMAYEGDYTAWTRIFYLGEGT